jgi:hypothetical protein
MVITGAAAALRSRDLQRVRGLAYVVGPAKFIFRRAHRSKPPRCGQDALFPWVNRGNGASRGPRRTRRTGRCAGLWAYESPRNQTPVNMNLGEMTPRFRAQSQLSCGLAGFCRADYCYDPR